MYLILNIFIVNLSGYFMADFIISKCPICKENHLETKLFLDYNILLKAGVSYDMPVIYGFFCSLDCFNEFLEKFNLKAEVDKISHTFMQRLVLKIGDMTCKKYLHKSIKNTPHRILKSDDDEMRIGISIKDIKSIKKSSKKQYQSNLKAMLNAIRKKAVKTTYLQ